MGTKLGRPSAGQAALAIPTQIALLLGAHSALGLQGRRLDRAGERVLTCWCGRDHPSALLGDEAEEVLQED